MYSKLDSDSKTMKQRLHPKLCRCYDDKAWHGTAEHSGAQHSRSTAGAMPDAVTGHARHPCAYLVISFSFLLIFLLAIYLLTRRPAIQYLQCAHTHPFSLIPYPAIPTKQRGLRLHHATGLHQTGKGQNPQAEAQNCSNETNERNVQHPDSHCSLRR